MSDLRPPKPSAVPSVKATGGFLPVLGQRPAPPHRMTCADAMKLGAMCNLCPLSKGKLAPLIVPPSAVAEPKFIIVGEGPGRVEQATAKPFVGPPGQFLNRLLQEAGVDRAQGHITSVSLCMGDTDKEKERAAECCSPRLLRELAALPADIPILTLGKFALKTVLGTGKLFTQRGSARGFFWRSPVIDDATVRTAQRKFEKNTHPDLERRALTLAGRAARRNVEAHHCGRYQAFRSNRPRGAHRSQAGRQHEALQSLCDAREHPKGARQVRLGRGVGYRDRRHQPHDGRHPLRWCFRWTPHDRHWAVG